MDDCGKKGIRTLGTRKSTTVFETAPIDHSGIFPVQATKLHYFSKYEAIYRLKFTIVLLTNRYTVW